MAEDLVRVQDHEPEDEDGYAAEPTDDDEPPYQSRFQLLFGVLLGVGMAAVVAAVIVLAGNGGTTANDQAAIAWAPWQPAGKNGNQVINQIADHVGRQYTLPSGHELVAVRGSSLEFLGEPVTIALEDRGNYDVLDAKGVLYNLCGLGRFCSIREGKPSIARHLVLRRESLELALYTFRYISNVEQVVVILPPAPGDKPSQVMFYRRGEVAGSLDRPLSATLRGPAPVPPNVPKKELLSLNSLTENNLFAYTPQAGGDARIYLVLSRPSKK